MLQIKEAPLKEREIELKCTSVGVFVMMDDKFKALFTHDGAIHLYNLEQVSKYQDRWDI